MSEWLTQMLRDAVASGSVLVYVLVFAGGVAASITPCTYPVLPLTVGYVGSAAGGRQAYAQEEQHAGRCNLRDFHGMLLVQRG